MTTTVKTQQPLYGLILMVSVFHLANDSLQSVIPALFPIIEAKMHLQYSDLGLIIFCNYLSAAFMQPVIGAYTDKKPLKYLLILATLLSLTGISFFLFANSIAQLLTGAILVGLGSSVFHPEASRIVINTAGNRKGLAQSIFQIGGNAGQALGPLLILLFFSTTQVSYSGNFYLLGFALASVILSMLVIKSYQGKSQHDKTLVGLKAKQPRQKLTRTQTTGLLIIVLITLSRTWYAAGITGYYALNLMQTENIDFTQAQLHVFVFMLFAALGTFAGGPLSDKFGTKKVLVVSAFLTLPFILAINFVAPPYTYILLAFAGFFLIAGFPVALIYLLELIPGRTGFISGIIFGLSFGLGGLGSLIFGIIGDKFGITTMMFVCSVVPILGLFVFLLPTQAKNHITGE